MKSHFWVKQVRALGKSGEKTLDLQRPHDEIWMDRALDLASRGQGCVEPNPMVGAVVLSATGEFLAEGFHQRFGGPHAEVEALQHLGNAAQGGTLYVTLEPCCHHGKTPPCTDMVLKSGVARVVVAMLDPFPKVAGGGVKILRDAGLEVEVGVHGDKAARLNAPYSKRLRTGQPWVIAKWAMTLDGKIATATGESQWISGDESRARVHELRGRVDAILVGGGTVRADDPLLTARPPGPRMAMRVIITNSGDLPTNSKLLSTAREVPVTILTRHPAKVMAWRDAGATVAGMPAPGGLLEAEAILNYLGERGVTNVLVEGGAKLLGSLHDAGAIDETWVFIAPKLFGGPGLNPIAGVGVKMEAVRPALDTSLETLGNDVLIRTRFS
jgi:diaminohydroxyphosphoribosylaminopyrimidine deaminase / 5-amino-6-(5-phosphoribosylamino)uracil reductase